MSFAAWYADDDDNFGPLKNMRAKPVWNVSKANRSLGEGWESMEPECTEISHILASVVGVVSIVGEVGVVGVVGVKRLRDRQIERSRDRQIER